MKLKNKILMVAFFIGTFFVFSNVSFAGEQRLNLLDYQAKLNSDGSMDVIETWDIYISETNTLFKDFELDSSKYSGISNVKVKNSTTGEELTQIDQEMYHVTQERIFHKIQTSKNNHYQIDVGEYFRDIPREKEATPVEAYSSYRSAYNVAHSSSSSGSGGGGGFSSGGGRNGR